MGAISCGVCFLFTVFLLQFPSMYSPTLSNDLWLLNQPSSNIVRAVENLIIESGQNTL